jgi:hypothetical protein
MKAEDFILEGLSLIEKGKRLIEYGEQLKQGEPLKKPKRIPTRKDPLAIARSLEIILKDQAKYLAKHSLK